VGSRRRCSRAAALTIAALGVGGPLGAHGASVEGQVRDVLSAYAAGKFPERGAELRDESGWQLALPSGRSVSRAFLQAQAGPLIALGPAAVEPLIAWVGSATDPASRYVAIYALERLTGRRPPISHTSPPDADTLARAAAEWRAGARGP